MKIKTLEKKNLKFVEFSIWEGGAFVCTGMGSSSESAKEAAIFGFKQITGNAINI